MQIIEELEPVRRGVYGGAIGYFGFSGNMDTGIAIRTVLIKNGRVFVQAGAGIVADSVPEREHLECLNKARGMFQALRTAEELASR
jgi:anthranilate synthase component 1